MTKTRIVLCGRLMSEKLKLGSRVAVSLICFAVVFTLIDVDKIASLIKDIQLEIILLALFFMLLGHIGSGLRFHFIVNRLKRKLDMPDAIRVSFVALWFNQLLPTGMGGDVVRAIMLAKTCGRARIILSALLDRVFGLLWMVLMMLLFVPAVLMSRLGVEATIAIGLLCLLILMLGFLPIWIKAGLCQLATNKHICNLCRFLSLLGHAMRLVVFTSTFYKMLFYLALSFVPYVIYVALIGYSFGLELTLLEYLAVVPVIFIAMQFPISIGGWGVRELAALYVFTYMGISEEVAVIISILYGFGLLVTSFPGNLFWIQRRHSASSATA